MLGNDQGVSALNYSAWNMWHLGQADAARMRAREAVALARRLNDPFSLAFALLYETVVHALRRDVTAQLERAAETIALSEAQGFPFWLGLGRAFHAGARVAAGHPDAFPEMLEGLALVAETGNQLHAPEIFLYLAEAQQASGHVAEAQGTVATALAVAAQMGQSFFDADLYRLDGDLLRALGGPADEAAARYHRALAIARKQGARSLELRAPVARSGQARRSARPTCARVRLVHRRLRDARPR